MGGKKMFIGCTMEEKERLIDILCSNGKESCVFGYNVDDCAYGYCDSCYEKTIDWEIEDV